MYCLTLCHTARFEVQLSGSIQCLQVLRFYMWMSSDQIHHSTFWCEMCVSTKYNSLIKVKLILHSLMSLLHDKSFYTGNKRG